MAVIQIVMSDDMVVLNDGDFYTNGQVTEVAYVVLAIYF